MKIEWTEPAEDDLGQIFDYIAKDSFYYAEQFIDRIISRTGKLNDFPEIGRQVPEAEGETLNVRELVIQGYRIIYVSYPDLIQILAVIHGSQDLQNFPNKPWEE